jgi:hypothetical protein
MITLIKEICKGFILEGLSRNFRGFEQEFILTKKKINAIIIAVRNGGGCSSTPMKGGV